MEISNLKNNIIQDQNLNIEQEQKSFLETAIGQVISKSLDIGLKILLPDFIDEQVINLKNNLFENGIKDGIRKTLDDTIELGKSQMRWLTLWTSVNQSMMQTILR